MAHMLMGIDLGTSGVRAGITTASGDRIALASRPLPIETKTPGVAEQDPELWWKGSCEAIREALAKAGLSGSDIAGISLSGQMHGGVMLDASDAPVGRAVIWADTRSASECAELDELIGTETLRTTLMNRFFPGTTAATAYWMRKHDPRSWERVRRILLPKDYLRFRMCGLFQSEPSDASSTLLFDLEDRDWSDEVLGKLRIPIEYLPPVLNSDQVVSETEGMEELSGLPDGVPIVTGGADQAVAALGNGILDPGSMFVAIGSGGQIVTPLSRPAASPDFSLNVFCHLPETRWYLMGATLSAGMSLRWWRDRFAPGVSFGELDSEAAGIPPGSAGLVFEPFLSGRRQPEPDVTKAGSFHGICQDHDRGHFVRAILEGVAFDLRGRLDAIRRAGVRPETAIVTGGGARSGLWTRIIADVFDLPLGVSGVEEQACFGAALLAGIGIGAFRNYRDAAAVVPKPLRIVEPDRGNAALYGEMYAEWRTLTEGGLAP
jgi:xylulokinase